MARVKAILRRARPILERAPSRLAHRDLVLEPAKHKVTVSGQPVALTPSEYTLLRVLMATPGRVFLREELLQHLHPRGEEVIDRVIDVHIGRLRQKIEEVPSAPQYILTVRGVGYQFAERAG